MPVNLVLFEPDEIGEPLPRSDSRAAHVRDVLRRVDGDYFDAGVVNGAIGVATVTRLDGEGLRFTFRPTQEPPPLPPVTLIIGLPRPATAKDILRDATTMGVEALHFVTTERTNDSYATSSLWRDGEWRRHLLLGAAQAFDTRLPIVTWHQSLGQALEGGAAGERLALDNYEGVRHLSTGSAPKGPILLAIGPERGWGPRDRDQLRSNGSTLCHLGPRVLRVEMAVVAALALVSARG